jgi:DNA-binding CsgD family transcriptional regulator
MSLSISGTVPVPLADTTAPAQAPAKQAAKPQPPADTVVLSQSAQINSLYLQGQSPQQIAENLGLSQLIVNSDLSLAVSTVTSPPASAPVTTSQPSAAPAATPVRSTSAA